MRSCLLFIPAVLALGAAFSALGFGAAFSAFGLGAAFVAAALVPVALVVLGAALVAAALLADLALIAAPHVMGAPQADVHESLAPASLAVQFVVASIATAFVYWLFLGGVLGFLLSKAIARERGHPA